MDRRSFLKLFSATSLASLGTTGHLIAIEGQRFTSPLLGLEFSSPYGWHSHTTDEIQAQPENIIGTRDDDFCDEDYFTPTPIVSFCKFKEPVPQFNPGIYLYADQYESWMDGPIQVLDLIVESIEEFGVGFRLINSVHLVELNKKEFAKVTLAQTLVLPSVDFRHDVINKFYMTEHNGFLIWFAFEESQKTGESMSITFNSTINSITFR